jgi:hypothetical protein
MLLKISATRTPQGALKFVALIIKILSCNKKKKFMVYDQNYHNCSTLKEISVLYPTCLFLWAPTAKMMVFLCRIGCHAPSHMVKTDGGA